MKLTKGEWFVACLPAILFFVVLSWAIWLPRLPEATQEQTVNIDNTTVANWIYQEQVNNNIEGDNMALAEAYEVSGTLSHGYDGTYTKESETVYKRDSTNYLYVWSEFGDSYWGLGDDFNEPPPFIKSSESWDTMNGVVIPPDECTYPDSSPVDSNPVVTAITGGGSSDLKIVMRNGQKYAVAEEE